MINLFCSVFDRMLTPGFLIYGVFIIWIFVQYMVFNPLFFLFPFFFISLFSSVISLFFLLRQFILFHDLLQKKIAYILFSSPRGWYGQQFTKKSSSFIWHNWPSTFFERCKPQGWYGQQFTKKSSALIWQHWPSTFFDGCKERSAQADVNAKEGLSSFICHLLNTVICLIFYLSSPQFFYFPLRSVIFVAFLFRGCHEGAWNLEICCQLANKTT